MTSFLISHECSLCLCNVISLSRSSRQSSTYEMGSTHSPKRARFSTQSRWAPFAFCNVAILKGFYSSQPTVLDPDPLPIVGKRMDRKINLVDNYRTVWYPSTGNKPVDIDTLARLDLTPEPQHADIFFHQYEQQQSQLFIYDTAWKWVPIKGGHQHPRLKSYRLNVKPSGALSWVKSQTLSTYRGPARMRGAPHTTT